MRYLYTLIFFILLPFAFFRLWRRGAKLPAYRQRWGERLGKASSFNKEFKLDKSKNTLWFHTVSVGEFIAARPLIQHYLDQTNTQVLITCTTPTGSERIQETFQGKVAHCYLPYDIPLLLNRFLRATKPNKFVCIETELWPNLIHCCKKNEVPIVLANARLSEKSAKGYARFPSLTYNMLSTLNAAAIQNQGDAGRFIELGLAPAKSHVIGSIKFDLDLDDALIEKASQLKSELTKHNEGLIWIAASTHKGEDEIILSSFKKLKEQHPSLKLILVPRHPERFGDVYDLCASSGFTTIRRSSGEAAAFDILLGDTMGELLLLFGASDFAFIGGSLIDNGGHNYIEPAAWALPLFSGSSTYNFRETSKELVDEQAMILTDSDTELAEAISTMLAEDGTMQTMGQQAKLVADRNRGALGKLIEIIDSVAT